MNSRSINPWWTVIAGALACAVGAGVLIGYMWGIFAESIAAEFRWDRSTAAFCLTCFLVATGFGTVSLGAAIARFGVRKSTAAYVGLFGASVAAVALLPNSPALFYLVFAVMGFAGAAATAMPYAVAITGWFDRRRGMALGIAVFGSGLGATLGPQFAHHVIYGYGWRLGFLFVAAIVTIIPVLGLIFLVRDPPRVVPPVQGPYESAEDQSVWRSYLGQKEFWLIAFPVLGVSITTIGVVASSLVPLLTDRGFTNSQVAAVLSVAGIGSWVGRIGVGYAMDKIFAPYVAATILILTLCGIGLIAQHSSGPLVVAGAALVGLALGSEADVVTFLVSRYFKFRIYSKVLGAMWLVWAWGGGFGAYFGGATYHVTHSYDVSMAVFAAILLMSSVVVCRLGPYRYPAAHRATLDAQENSSTSIIASR